MKSSFKKIILFIILSSMLCMQVIPAMADSVEGIDDYTTIGGSEAAPAPSQPSGPAPQPVPDEKPASAPAPTKKTVKKQTKYNEKALETDAVSENTARIILSIVFTDEHSLDKDTLIFKTADSEISLSDYKGDAPEYTADYVEDERIRNILSGMVSDRRLDAAEAMQMYQDLSFSDSFYEILLSDESFACKFNDEFTEDYNTFLNESVSQNDATDTRILFLKNHFEKINAEKAAQSSLAENTLLYHSCKEDILTTDGKDEKVRVMIFEYFNLSSETCEWMLRYQDDCKDEELISFSCEVVDKEISEEFILENPPEPAEEPASAPQPEPAPVPEPEPVPAPVQDPASANDFSNILTIFAASYMIWAVIFALGIFVYKKKKG